MANHVVDPGDEDSRGRAHNEGVVARLNRSGETVAAGSDQEGGVR